MLNNIARKQSRISELQREMQLLYQQNAKICDFTWLSMIIMPHDFIFEY